MKPLLLTLTLLLTTLLPATAKVKKFNPNPINLATILVEKTDSAQVASTLTYYGYTPQGKEDGYQIMKDANGNEIRYSFNDLSTKYPTVTVKSTYTQKALDSRMKDLNFERKEKLYERKRNQYSKYRTQCAPGPKSTLILRHIPTNP